MVSLLRLGDLGQEIPVVRVGEKYLDLRAVTADVDRDFFARGGLAEATNALAAGTLPELPDAQDLRVGAPIAQPGKVVCIGLNYRDHASETRASIPTEPVVFFKDPATVVGPYDEVLIPRGSHKTDWEVELGVVIGSTARYLESTEAATSCIAGYAVSHDVSEREFQLERGGQWDKGKSCETFNPLGPELVLANAVPDPQSLGLRLWVNGELRQNGSTAKMIFSVSYLIWYVSQFMVLYPGDLVNTGTPAGVALGQPVPTYLKAGDMVQLEIDGLGRSQQTFVQA